MTPLLANEDAERCHECDSPAAHGEHVTVELDGPHGVPALCARHERIAADLGLWHAKKASA